MRPVSLFSNERRLNYTPTTRYRTPQGDRASTGVVLSMLSKRGRTSQEERPVEENDCVSVRGLLSCYVHGLSLRGSVDLLADGVLGGLGRGTSGGSVGLG